MVIAAREKFAELIEARQEEAVEAVTVGKLSSAFLAWVQANRGPAQCDRRRRDCPRFTRFHFAGNRLADLSAFDVTGQMLEAWRDNLKATKPEGGAEGKNDRDKVGLDPQSLRHAEVSVRHAFNWGCNHPDPSFLPVTFDVDQFRQWGSERHTAKRGRANVRPYKGDFGDMLRVSHGTGARTSELAPTKVGQFSARSRQIVLGKRKRSRTTRGWPFSNAGGPGGSRASPSS